MNILKPTIYQKDIYSINYNKLLEQNINILLFDIDNTISSPKEKYPSKESIKLFETLKKQGFKIFIITNALKHRAENFSKKLNTKAYYLSFKPNKKQYLKIIEENKLNTKNIAAIGDQIYTDIKGANKLNITSILVDPVSNKDTLFTIPNRIKEKNLITKTKLIEKGKYYE